MSSSARMDDDLDDRVSAKIAADVEYVDLSAVAEIDLHHALLHSSDYDAEQHGLHIRWL